MGIEKSPSPEILDEKFGELLLSGELAGEGGRAVVIKISHDHVSQDLEPAFSSLSAGETEKDKAVKLFKLYLPNKGKNEYDIHARVQKLIEDLPEDKKDEYARVPKLSSSRDISFASETRAKLQEKFSLPALAEKSVVIAMEYIDGEDLATIFYKWILERSDPSLKRSALTPQQTDKMGFGELYIELSNRLGLEGLATGEFDAPQEVIDQADWKASQKNTEKIYAYLRKNKFPMPPGMATQIENTLKLMHSARMTHCDAFERNIMVTGGSKVLREKKTLEGEDPVLIDFGESRDHFVEEVDDFNVIRRLKTLSLSREEEIQLIKQKEFEAMGEKRELLKGNKKWSGIYETVQKIAIEDKKKALETAWNNTVILKESGLEDFFIIAKTLIEEGLMEEATIGSFLEDKRPKLTTPYQKNLLGKYTEWLNAS